MTKEELLHNPNIASDMSLQKNRDREEIKALVVDFLSKGGKIDVRSPGESADYNPIRKEKYDNRLKPHNLCGIKRL